MEMTLRSGAIRTRSGRYFSSALGRSPSSRDPLGRVASALDIRTRTEERRGRGRHAPRWMLRGREKIPHGAGATIDNHCGTPDSDPTFLVSRTAPNW